MSSVTKKSRKAAIAKNDPVFSILRCFSFEGDLKLSHAKWFENHKFGVKAVGRVLQFLDLAEPDKQSIIGWKAKPRLFQIAKKAKSLKCGTAELSKTQDDEFLLDTLYEIAIGVLEENDWRVPEYFDKYTYRQFEQSAAEFTSAVFEELGLTVMDDDEEKPTALLRELFTRGALKIGNAARSSCE